MGISFVAILPTPSFQRTGVCTDLPPVARCTHSAVHAFTNGTISCSSITPSPSPQGGSSASPRSASSTARAK